MTGDAAASLRDDQRARRRVPRLQLLLPESVESACGDVAQSRSRRSQGGEPRAPAEERAEQRDEIAQSLMDAVGKPGDEQCIDRAWGRGTASGSPLSYAPCPRSAVNSSWRVGIVNGADQRGHLSRARATHRRSEGRGRNSWCHRVDRRPTATGRDAGANCPEFFRQDVVRRETAPR